MFVELGFRAVTVPPASWIYRLFQGDSANSPRGEDTVLLPPGIKRTEGEVLTHLLSSQSYSLASRNTVLNQRSAPPRVLHSAVPHELKRNRLSPHVAVGSRVALTCRSPVPHETAYHASLWLPDSRLARVEDHTSVQWQDCPIRKTAYRTTLLYDCLFLIGKAGDHTSLWLGYAQIGKRQTTLLCGCLVPQSGRGGTTRSWWQVFPIRKTTHLAVLWLQRVEPARRHTMPSCGRMRNWEDGTPWFCVVA